MKQLSPPHTKGWIEKISKSLQNLSEAPLFGSGPAFDWESAALSLASKLGIPSLLLRPGKQKWSTKNEYKEGLPRSCITAFSLSPLETPLYWIMTKSDRDKFLGLVANGKEKKTFSSASLQEGFYRFLILEALDSIQNTDPFQQMTLQLIDEAQIPSNEPTFYIDVEILIDEISCWGRLVLTQTFQKNWVQHFSTFPPEYKTTELTKHLELILGVQIGSFSLTAKEWKKLKTGDFLLPELTYDPSHPEQTSGILVLGTTPLFQTKIQQDNIELIDYALTLEDTMNQKNPEMLAQKLEAVPEEHQKIKDIPLQVTVELARLKMTLDTLMHLSPGNTLELPVHADQKIALTINGQKVAQAELIELGETLGLRILEI